MQQRICIYGSGAIGGLLAGKLTESGAAVSCITRGSHLAAIRKNGLSVSGSKQEINARVQATDQPAELGEQDVVIIALKAHALVENITHFAGLIGPETTVVSVQNGLPWWYFYKDASIFVNRHLESVDPGGALWQALDPRRAIGAVVYPAATVTAPGIVRHISGNRFTLGEPDGSLSPRLQSLAALLQNAGFDVTPATNIRAEIWLKLAVNAAINPLSLIHQATIGEILSDNAKRQALTTSIEEAQRVAKAVGVEPLMLPTALVDALDVVKEHKTSMLVDYERGRPLELQALTGAVVEIAGLANIAVPALRSIHLQALRLVSGELNDLI